MRNTSVLQNKDKCFKSKSNRFIVHKRKRKDKFNSRNQSLMNPAKVKSVWATAFVSTPNIFINFQIHNNGISGTLSYLETDFKIEVVPQARLHSYHNRNSLPMAQCSSFFNLTDPRTQIHSEIWNSSIGIAVKVCFNL